MGVYKTIHMTVWGMYKTVIDIYIGNRFTCKLSCKWLLLSFQLQSHTLILCESTQMTLYMSVTNAYDGYRHKCMIVNDVGNQLNSHTTFWCQQSRIHTLRFNWSPLKCPTFRCHPSLTTFYLLLDGNNTSRRHRRRLQDSFSTNWASMWNSNGRL